MWIWDILTVLGETTYKLNDVAEVGHTDSVSSMKLDGTVLLTASADKTVKVWHLSPSKVILKRTLEGIHQRGLKAIDFNDKYIVSGGAVNFLVVWHMNTHEFAR